jgi:hypothetical protein
MPLTTARGGPQQLARLGHDLGGARRLHRVASAGATLTFAATEPIRLIRVFGPPLGETETGRRFPRSEAGTRAICTQKWMIRSR